MISAATNSFMGMRVRVVPHLPQDLMIFEDERGPVACFRTQAHITWMVAKANGQRLPRKLKKRLKKEMRHA